ncbi:MULTISPECIES: hypothetical protein [unclassified Okeania]|uniref:hypothetical protein n=1 Tax=unclassified Okeania TaxID=2634635 RepID=UPI0025803A02|nr:MULTISPECIES: hypothetical protein [unclassified Okeania]
MGSANSSSPSLQTDARMTGDAASGGRRNSPIAGLINRLRPFKTSIQSRFEGLWR